MPYILKRLTLCLIKLDKNYKKLSPEHINNRWKHWSSEENDSALWQCSIWPHTYMVLRRKKTLLTASSLSELLLNGQDGDSWPFSFSSSFIDWILLNKIYCISTFHFKVETVAYTDCFFCCAAYWIEVVFTYLLTYLIGHNNPINKFRPAAMHPFRRLCFASLR